MILVGWIGIIITFELLFSEPCRMKKKLEKSSSSQRLKNYQNQFKSLDDLSHIHQAKFHLKLRPYIFSKILPCMKSYLCIWGFLTSSPSFCHNDSTQNMDPAQAATQRRNDDGGTIVWFLSASFD